MSHMGHEHDDLSELGGLSTDERDRLADYLRREQDLEHEQEELVIGWPDAVVSAVKETLHIEAERRYGTNPTTTQASRAREHVTDGTPCWCEPTIEDYR